MTAPWHQTDRVTQRPLCGLRWRLASPLNPQSNEWLGSASAGEHRRYSVTASLWTCRGCMSVCRGERGPLWVGARVPLCVCVWVPVGERMCVRVCVWRRERKSKPVGECTGVCLCVCVYVSGQEPPRDQAVKWQLRSDDWFGALLGGPMGEETRAHHRFLLCTANNYEVTVVILGRQW